MILDTLELAPAAVTVTGGRSVSNLCCHGDRSGLVGLPKVKRDKFSVFNFLTVADSRGDSGELTSCFWRKWSSSVLTSSSFYSSAPPQPTESGKRSRWDISVQQQEQQKEDTLSELISTAREQSSAPTPPISGSSSKTEVDFEEHLQGLSSGEQEPQRVSCSLFTQMKKNDGEEEQEEEEEEECRPPMDLFKAIFSGSSDEKSSSSSDEESNDEEDAKEEEPLNLFHINSSVTSSVSTSTVTSSQPPSKNSQKLIRPSMMSITKHPDRKTLSLLKNTVRPPGVPRWGWCLQVNPHHSHTWAFSITKRI